METSTEEGEEQLWECGNCSFLNLSSVDACEICHQIKVDETDNEEKEKESEFVTNDDAPKEVPFFVERPERFLKTWTENEEQELIETSSEALSILNVEEIMDHIFSFLPFDTELLPRVSLVCRKWRRLALSHIRPLPSWKRTSSSAKVETMLKIMNTFGRSAQIKTLDFSHCEGLTNGELALFPPTLEELDISHCPWINAAGLNNLPSSLTAIDISACASLYLDVGLCFLAQTLTKLQRLHMRDYDNIGQSCISELNNKTFPHLKHLDLRGTHLTHEHARTVLTSFRNLESLHFSHATPSDRVWKVEVLPLIQEYHGESLKHFTIWSYITQELAYSLPRSLLTLHLYIPLPGQLDAEHFKAFPPSLTQLTITSLRDRIFPAKMFTYFAQSLHSLEILEMETNAIDDLCMQEIQTMTSLKILRLIGKKAQIVAYPMQPGLVFTDTGLRCIPPNLQVLEIKHAYNAASPLPWEYIPSSLRTLKIDVRLRPVFHPPYLLLL